jgi:hypothetical protein
MSELDIQEISKHSPNFLTAHFKISICVFQNDWSEKVLSETEFSSYTELSIWLTKTIMAKKAFELIGLKVITEEDRERVNLKEELEALKEK